jgi:hypothetical protein
MESQSHHVAIAAPTVVAATHFRVILIEIVITILPWSSLKGLELVYPRPINFGLFLSASFLVSPADSKIFGSLARELVIWAVMGVILGLTHEPRALALRRELGRLKPGQLPRRNCNRQQITPSMRRLSLTAE